MQLRRLWLTDFRGYREADVSFDPGLTAVLGPNGHGKTNLLEAIGYLATLSSFRGAPTEALIRSGADRAVVRAEAEREGRELLLEAELVASGRNRTQLNKQPLRRARDLLGALRVTVFSPDDLTLVKGSPGDRRSYLDEMRGDLDKVLRQRGALLKQSGGRLTPEIELTLDVFDAKLVTAGEALASARRNLVAALEPLLSAAYDAVAQRSAEVRATYDPPWMADGLAAALAASRQDDLRRGVSTVGPHRDELELVIGAMPSRTHASQGEQRSLALALRLAAHHVVTEQTETSPVLLLDDVFSELDPERSHALLESLPEGQTVLSTASGLPPGVVPGAVVQVHDGVAARG